MLSLIHTFFPVLMITSLAGFLLGYDMVSSAPVWPFVGDMSAASQTT